MLMRFRFILYCPQKEETCFHRLYPSCSTQYTHKWNTDISNKNKYTVSAHDTRKLHQMYISSPTRILTRRYSTNKTIELPSFCEFNILIAEGTKLFPKRAFLGGNCLYLRPDEEE